MNAPTNFEFCPRCSGKGKLDWTDHDGGVCYKCEGKGYIGERNDEFDSYVIYLDELRKNAAKLSKMRSAMINSIVTKLNGRKDYTISDLIIMNRVSGEYVFSGYKSEYVSLFEAPYVDELFQLKRYSVKGLNASFIPELKEQDLNKFGKSFVAKYENVLKTVGDEGNVTIQKVDNNSIKISFNI